MKMFKGIVSIALVCLTATTGFTQEHRAGMKLIPKASTEEFIQYFRRIGEVIQNAKADLSNDDSAALQKVQRISAMEEKFKRLCGDQDYEDEIITNQSTTNAVSISFTCYENNSLKEGSSFIFELDEDSKLSNFSEVVVQNNGTASNDKKLVKIIFRESIALVAATTLSVLTAKMMLPGQADKMKHAGVSAIMSSLITSAAYHFFKVSPKKAGVMGLSACLLVGAGKEWYDSKHPDRHDAEMNDFLADSVGCVSGAGFVTYAISW